MTAIKQKGAFSDIQLDGKLYHEENLLIEESAVPNEFSYKKGADPVEETDLVNKRTHDTKLSLDQTTPETIENGIPLLEETRVIDEPHQLVDKLYVDNAVAFLGMRFYMTDVDSGITQPVTAEEYKLTDPVDPSAFNNTYVDLTDGIYIDGWISPEGQTPSKLIAGIYSWNIFLEKSAGTKPLRVYWTLVNRTSAGVETVIETSANSNLIDAKIRERVPLNLSNDYTPASGSRIIGKIYAVVGATGSAPTIKIYGGGTDDSHWETPTNKEILDTFYVSYETILTSGKIPVATTGGKVKDLTAQAYESPLKIDYTTGDLDTEAEIITAINATNTKINAIITKLETLKLLASS